MQPHCKEGRAVIKFFVAPPNGDVINLYRVMHSNVTLKVSGEQIWLVSNLLG